jgi:hypothetical protein
MRSYMTILSLAFLVSACDKTEKAGNEGPSPHETSGATTSAVAAAPPVDAPGKPAVTCEQAYADLKDLVEGLEEQLGSSDSDLPKREEFLASCEALPTEIQNCMVFEYAMANQEQCQERVDALEPEQRQSAQELMGK